MNRTNHILHAAGQHITCSMYPPHQNPQESKSPYDQEGPALPLTARPETRASPQHPPRRYPPLCQDQLHVTLTTDNTSEFLDHESIEALFRRHGAHNVYYIHAYAACGKGFLGNANRLVLRWYPKGTDFSCVSPARIAALESAINSIHCKLLGGQTAQEAYHAAV